MKNKIFKVILNILPYIISIIIFFIYAPKYDLWNDEGYHFACSKTFIEDNKFIGWNFLEEKYYISKNRYHKEHSIPPDYSEYVRAKTLTKICGYFGKLFGWSELSIRLVPFIIFMLSIFLCHLFFLFFKKENIFILLFFCFFSAGHIITSQFIRAYSSLGLVVICTLFTPILWKNLLNKINIKNPIFITKLIILSIITLLILYLDFLSIKERWQLEQIPLFILIVSISLIYFFKPNLLINKKMFFYIFILLLPGFILLILLSYIVPIPEFLEEIQPFSIQEHSISTLLRGIFSMFFVIPLFFIYYIYYFSNKNHDNKKHINAYFHYIMTFTILYFFFILFLTGYDQMSFDFRYIYIILITLTVCISFLIPFKYIYRLLKNYFSKPTIIFFITIICLFSFCFQIYFVNWTIKNERTNFGQVVYNNMQEYSNSIFISYYGRESLLLRKNKFGDIDRYNIKFYSTTFNENINEKIKVQKIINDAKSKNLNIYFIFMDNNILTRQFYKSFTFDLLNIKHELKPHIIYSMKDFTHDKNRLLKNKLRPVGCLYLIHKAE